MDKREQELRQKVAEFEQRKRKGLITAVNIEDAKAKNWGEAKNAKNEETI